MNLQTRREDFTMMPSHDITTCEYCIDHNLAGAIEEWNARSIKNGGEALFSTWEAEPDVVQYVAPRPVPQVVTFEEFYKQEEMAARS